MPGFLFSRVILLLAALCLTSPALAAGTDSSDSSYNSKAKPAGYSQAVKLIKAEDFAAALPALGGIGDQGPE